jgi:hypothetical protein
MTREEFETLIQAHNIVLVGDAAWRVAQLVAAQEREACAKTCEFIASNPSSLWSEDGCWRHAAEACASEIRGRS